MTQSFPSATEKRVRGFTLIEMLLVVAILVALAGMVLPKLDKEQLRANKGIAANNMTGVSRYIQTYRIRHNVYPDRWDSLLNAAGTALWAPGVPGSAAMGIDPQLTGGPPTGSPTKLKVATSLTDLELRSLNRMNITSLNNLASSPSSPGAAFTVPMSLTTNSTFATINDSDSDGRNIIDTIYPENRLSTGHSGALRANKKLIVFGFGPTNQAIGDVLQECPTYANTDPTQYYNHFLVIFEYDSTGSRAEFKLAVGGDADLLGDEVGDYFEK